MVEFGNELEVLYRELYSEYERLRNAREFNRSAIVSHTILNNPDPLYFSQIMAESLQRLRQRLRRRQRLHRMAEGEISYDTSISTLSNFGFIVPVSMGFTYSQVRPDEHVVRGYNSGVPRGFYPDVNFTSMRTVTSEKIQGLFYYLGNAYRRSDIDPVDFGTQHLQRIRSYREI